MSINIDKIITQTQTKFLKKSPSGKKVPNNLLQKIDEQSRTVLPTMKRFKQFFETKVTK